MSVHLFDNQKPDKQKLCAFGFFEEAGSFRYDLPIVDNQFRMTVIVSPEGEVRTQVTDVLSGEAYVLHQVDRAAGDFVGRVRAEYQAVLEAIADQCFLPDVFRQAETQALLSYVQGRYGDQPEFLWQKFPAYAILRRKDTGKWYAAVMRLPLRKLGLDTDEMAEVVNLRIPPKELAETLDGVRYFPGWHMNKKHWYTLLLDGSGEEEDLHRRVEESYQLAL